MDAVSREKQFWLRVMLFAGLLWGMRLLINIPLIVRSDYVNPFILSAVFFNGFTVLPACALAFWHRRIACIWLSLDAVVLIAAFCVFLHSGGIAGWSAYLALSLAFGLAFGLDWTELNGWPTALAPR